MRSVWCWKLFDGYFVIVCPLVSFTTKKAEIRVVRSFLGFFKLKYKGCEEEEGFRYGF